MIGIPIDLGDGTVHMVLKPETITEGEMSFSDKVIMHLYNQLQDMKGSEKSCTLNGSEIKSIKTWVDRTMELVDNVGDMGEHVAPIIQKQCEQAEEDLIMIEALIDARTK